MMIMFRRLRSLHARLCHINSKMESVKKVKASGYETVAVPSNGLSADVTVDLRSDTVTKPGTAMRLAMAEAQVGDDVFREDPTVIELEAKVARTLGKAAGLFVTSGTMGNFISAMIHCNERGSEMIVGDQSHMFRYEQGNASQFGGIHSNQVKNNDDGTFDINGVVDRIRPDDIHDPITKLIAVENSHNRCGGRVMPLNWLDQLGKCAKEHNIPLHMDGARVFNAAIALEQPVSRIVKDFDSVSVCLSKGLGAPFGSVIVGSVDFVEKARRLRKAIGGGLRQAGILAGAGIYCLDHMVDRLRDDHEHAKIIARMINNLSSQRAFVNYDDVETNIVMVRVIGINITAFCKRLAIVEQNERDTIGSLVSVKCLPWSETSTRLVTHADISKEMAVQAAEKICYVIKGTKEV
ncbi:putative low-specificity L-threonine aldolase 2 [Folsomia candida]|uniref:Putative low-specificity L-threonine aldolase 2 n=1 Tax=Folsomia candida TaxID=158441 RepID=A0A226F636_FOLCA|nr:putative low-specificity L-threonine aldolase 2 [Folsomia candida]